MTQLPLDLKLTPRFGRDDYLIAPANAEAVALLDRWPDWPDRVLLLIGPEGSGKSHLAAIWAARTGARTVAATDLCTTMLRDSADVPVVVEDADRIGDKEARLFHLLNLVRQESSFLLLTARRPPELWDLATADLLSRLRLGLSVTIGAPDDDLIRAVLVKLFADRQLLVDEALVSYLVLRLDRSLDAARHVVDALDRASLALSRRVTRPLAAKVLDTLDRNGIETRKAELS